MQIPLFLITELDGSVGLEQVSAMRSEQKGGVNVNISKKNISRPINIRAQLIADVAGCQNASRVHWYVTAVPLYPGAHDTAHVELTCASAQVDTALERPGIWAGQERTIVR